MTESRSLAVALHYEKQDGGAPRVVASGRGAGALSASPSRVPDTSAGTTAM